MTDTNTSRAVYVLGDAHTSQHMELLTAKAAERGAVIGQSFAFGPGEASRAEDLSTVDAVVEALGRAIATRTDVWLPFWRDVSRERHMRTLSITLQRHGLSLLVGPDLMAVPTTGGVNDLDAALRNEIRAAYALDDAAMAAAGMHSLGAEIEAVLATAGASAGPVEEGPRQRHFDISEVATLLGKSPKWVLRGLLDKAFLYADGSRVKLERRPAPGSRVFTEAMVLAIAWSAYRRGSLKTRRFEGVLAELARSER